MNRVIILFVVATLIVAGGVYMLISTTTPLTPGQALGSGVAFLLGWLGLAYSGSEALQAMIRRRRARLASAERAPDRAAAVVRRYTQNGSVPEPALARLDRWEQPATEARTEAPEDQARASSLTRASIASTRSTSATRNAAS